MPVADDLVQRVSALSPDELEDLIGRVAAPPRLVTPTIVKTPGVCGGSARVIRTRIPVWLLEEYRRLGMSEAEMLRAYPTLRAVDLVEAWQYADTHVEEMDREIRENNED
jgi:uncharacterized protein (DUF433 family)